MQMLTLLEDGVQQIWKMQTTFSQELVLQSYAMV
jgi:hypothetical protein